MRGYTGLKKTTNSSLSFGQGALTFCTLRATSCLSQLMIILEADLPGHVSFENYFPNKEIYIVLVPD